MSIVSRSTITTALLLFSSISTSRSYRLHHLHHLIVKANRSIASSSINQFNRAISFGHLTPGHPRLFRLYSAVPERSIMSRRSSRSTAATSTTFSKADDDKHEALRDHMDTKKSPSKGAAKKIDGDEGKSKAKKKVSPKQSKGATSSIVTASEDGDTKQKPKKKPSPKKRSVKGSVKNPDHGSDNGEAKPSPKKKSKAADHQRWTERTPLTRHWDAKAAAEAGSYTFTVISWNVAGLRTFIKKNPDVFANLAKTYDADVICLQETKLQEDNLNDSKLKLKEYFDEKLVGYDCHFSCSVEKKGYSGTAMFIKKYGDDSKKGKKQSTLGAFFGNAESAVKSRGEDKVKGAEVPTSDLQPVVVTKELGIPAHDGEGRTITAEFPLFYLTNVYVPNSGQKLDRLSYRTKQWDKDFVNKMQQLEKDGNKPIIWLGDLNVAYDEKDTWNEGAKHLAKSAGTTPEERAAFAEQLSAGFIDVFRHLHPHGKGHYSYWSQRAGNREPNKGLRLDYFICSKDMILKGGDNDGRKAIVRDSFMVPDQLGSDHCPIILEIEIKK